MIRYKEEQTALKLEISLCVYQSEAALVAEKKLN